MKVKITKHINKIFVGLIGEVDNLKEIHPLVKFKNGKIECFKLNLEKVDDNENISTVPPNYVRRKGEFHIKGIGEGKSLTDEIDIFKNTQDYPVGARKKLIDMQISKIEGSKNVKKEIPKFF